MLNLLFVQVVTDRYHWKKSSQKLQTSVDHSNAPMTNHKAGGRESNADYEHIMLLYVFIRDLDLNVFTLELNVFVLNQTLNVFTLNLDLNVFILDVNLNVFSEDLNVFILDVTLNVFGLDLNVFISELVYTGSESDYCGSKCVYTGSESELVCTGL